MLTDMLAAIEAAVAKGTQGPWEAKGNSVRPAGWTPKFPGQSSPGFCNVCGPGYGTSKNAPGNVQARHDARLIAAMLNAAPGMCEAARERMAHSDRLGSGFNPPYHDERESRGIDDTLEALLQPYYDALVAAGAITQGESDGKV